MTLPCRASFTALVHSSRSTFLRWSGTLLGPVPPYPNSRGLTPRGRLFDYDRGLPPFLCSCPPPCCPSDPSFVPPVLGHSIFLFFLPLLTPWQRWFRQNFTFAPSLSRFLSCFLLVPFPPNTLAFVRAVAFPLSMGSLADCREFFISPYH